MPSTSTFRIHPPEFEVRYGPANREYRRAAKRRRALPLPSDLVTQRKNARKKRKP